MNINFDNFYFIFLYIGARIFNKKVIESVDEQIF